jgi:predicted phage tail component-like protein
MSITVSLGGVANTALNLIVTDVRRPIVPGFDDKYQSIEGMDGAYLFPGKQKNKPIEVDFYLNKDTIENLQLALEYVAEWLYLTDWTKFEISDQPNKWNMVKLTDQVDPRQIISNAGFTVRFVCQPSTYKDEVSQAFAADAVTVNNTGTKETLPRFAVTFSTSATEWKVTMGGKYLRVVHSFISTDTLEVNCMTGAVLHNGLRAMNLLDWQYSDLHGFYLPKGSTNLNITPTGKCSTTIYWKPLYVY